MPIGKKTTPAFTLSNFLFGQVPTAVGRCSWPAVLVRRSMRILLRSCSNQARTDYHLAHMNYARLKAPLEDESMSEFRLAIDPVNQLARNTPGFVWSLDDCSELRHNVPCLRNDPLLMPQLSLWENIPSIQHFAFKSGHAMYWRRRHDWFHKNASPDEPYTVCWWRSAMMEPPTLVEAFDRLETLRKCGPSPEAFTLKTQFPKPSISIAGSDSPMSNTKLTDC